MVHLLLEPWRECPLLQAFYSLGQWPWMLNRHFSNFFWLQYGSVLFFLGKGHYMQRKECLCTASYICVGGRGPFSCSWLYNTWLESPYSSRGLTVLTPTSLPIPTDVVFNKMRSCLQSRVSYSSTEVWGDWVWAVKCSIFYSKLIKVLFSSITSWHGLRVFSHGLV